MRQITSPLRRTLRRAIPRVLQRPNILQRSNIRQRIPQPSHFHQVQFVVLLNVMHPRSFIQAGFQVITVRLLTKSKPFSPYRVRILIGVNSFGEQGCISCRTAPKTKLSALCQPCYENAMIMAPMIIPIPEDHESYRSGTSMMSDWLTVWTYQMTVRTQFIQSWKHNTVCPDVRVIYKVICTEGSSAKYDQYLYEGSLRYLACVRFTDLFYHRDMVEAKGNFAASRKSRGNEKRRWYGTGRKCLLGDPGNTEFCEDRECPLCCVIRTSFNLNFFTGGRFGTGIYTSSVSSKYVHTGEWVVVGYAADAEVFDLQVQRVFEECGYYIRVEGVTFEQGCRWKWDEVGSTYPIAECAASGIRFCEYFYLNPPAGGLTRIQVIGEVGPGALNYDRLVVYNNDAVRPAYLVMYEST